MSMSRFNPLLWPRPPVIWNYGVAVLSVIAAVIVSQWPALHLGAAPVSLFFCTVMLTAWFGGIGPGLLATGLSTVAFYYYFLSPVHSFAAKPDEMPRLAVFAVSAFVVGSLSAAQRSATDSLRRARDELKGAVQALRRTNDDLQTESRERKHAEEELRHTQADLARASRVTTMGELTASLAHEVNQPIAAAVTDASTCLRWLAGDPPNLEEAREAAMRTVKDGRRAAEIVTRIRLLFKKGSHQRESVDLNDVIREMVIILRSEATRNFVSVQTDLATNLPFVMGDRVQLQQVLMNLMINGIDAMRDVDGTRELVIKSQPAGNEGLTVSVSDTGIGLPEKQAEQIFDAFFTTKTHGTGMGLSISRSIVEAHGGRLWVTNNSGRGATFHLNLATKTEEHE
jgi:C4-dicarboxylate-specific signal transduction histidine kinase